jgi:hypothetical protein
MRRLQLSPPAAAAVSGAGLHASLREIRDLQTSFFPSRTGEASQDELNSQF